MIVAHYNPSRLTISNTEFDGETTTSATCNGNHYWTMMFYGDGDQVTLDRNYIHDCSGRAPKLGEDGKTCYVQAVNNLFSNMEGHAFEAYVSVFLFHSKTSSQGLVADSEKPGLRHRSD